MQQFERSAAATFLQSNEQWDPCGTRAPIILIEQVKDVGIAVSLEIIHEKAINMPWLYLSVLHPHALSEQRFIMPIRLPESNSFLMAPFAHVFSTPLNDGLSPDETIELLMASLATTRRDMSEKLYRVVKTIKTIQEFGVAYNHSDKK